MRANSTARIPLIDEGGFRASSRNSAGSRKCYFSPPHSSVSAAAVVFGFPIARCDILRPGSRQGWSQLANLDVCVRNLLDYPFSRTRTEIRIER